MAKTYEMKLLGQTVSLDIVQQGCSARKDHDSRWFEKSRCVKWVVWILCLLGFSLPLDLVQAGEDIEVSVPEIMRACKTNQECTRVEISCSSCCRVVGINKKYEKEFYEGPYKKACMNYRGPVCDCNLPATIPACLDGTCGQVPFIPPKESPPQPETSK